jgi:predicted ribosomally synthesized peptide with nif11-like leader
VAAIAAANQKSQKSMNETLTNFRNAVADNADLQEKIKAGADLVALGKENGFEFTQEELETGWEELQESDEGLTDFELDVVSGGQRSGQGGC